MPKKKNETTKDEDNNNNNAFATPEDIEENSHSGYTVTGTSS
jgi:hypothetical protein